MLPLLIMAILAAPPGPVESYVHRVMTRGIRSRRILRLAPAYSRQLVAAAQHEGRRRGLDWRALLAVAEVETQYHWWARRPADGAYGPWQITGTHSGPLDARVLLRGCQRPHHGPCEAPYVAARRDGPGPWRPAELRDPWIAAYLAALEIQRHVVWCYRHHRHGHWTPRGCPRWLARWGHYQSGIGRPSRYYTRRLCAAYQRIVMIVRGARAIPMGHGVHRIIPRSPRR